MQIRRVMTNDMDLLVDNRLEFIFSFAIIPNPEEMREQTKNFILKHINDDTFISFIAVDGEKIVSSCILCIYETLPIPAA